MKTVFIPELQVECRLVSNYTDLVLGNLFKLIRTAYLSPSDPAVRLQLLRKLFEAPEIVWKHLEAPENHEQVWRLLQSLDWIFKGPKFRPAEFLRIRGKKFLFPDQELHHLGTAEFVVATAHLIAFYNAKDDVTAIGNLVKFTATIARPKPDVMEQIRSGRDTGDQREAYNSAKSERREKLFGKVDLVTQIMTAQWFNNTANSMLSAYGMSGGDPDAAPISQGIFVQDWERQVVRVAESQVYGNYDKVMERPLADVLAFIELKNDEIRRRINAQKGK